MAGESGPSRNACAFPRPGSSARTSLAARPASARPPASSPLCAASASRKTWAPARTCPSRLLALRQSATASSASDSSRIAIPSKRGRNGCVTATSGTPATSRIAICSVTISARRGATARSSVPARGRRGERLDGQRRRQRARHPHGAQHEGEQQGQRRRDQRDPAPRRARRPRRASPSRASPRAESDPAITMAPHRTSIEDQPAGPDGESATRRRDARGSRGAPAPRRRRARA